MTEAVRKVQLSVPDAYKPSVDEEVWSDLESYLYQGFLSAPAHIMGKTFVLKTVNHNELRYISYLRPLKTAPVEVRDAHRAALIAHSVFMVDGENLLPDRSRRMARLVKIIGRMPAGVQDSIVEHLSALNEKSVRLRPLVEVFVHENRSRFRWMHTSGTPVHSPSNTGIDGTDEIGMNYCQQAWSALNRLLDTREQMERDWVNAKFVGSCFAGKGVRSVDEKDRARAAREKADLEDLKMKVLHGYLNRAPSAGSEPEVFLPDGRRAVVVSRFRADSAQELADQMSAVLSEEKDHHDLVVEAKMRQIRERANSMEESRQAIYRAPAFAQASGPQVAGSSRVLGGKDEADALLARIRALQHSQVARHRRVINGTDTESSDEAPEGGD